MKLFIDIGIVVVTISMMLAVGLDLNRASISVLLRQRAQVGLLLLLHVIIPPLVGVMIVSALNLPPSLAASLLLLAACPIGDIANIYTVFARGNTALSLTLNAATCFLAPLTMVATFATMSWIGFEHQLLAVPALTLFGRLFLFLILPVSIGAWLTWIRPGLTSQIKPWLHRFTAIGIALMLVVILSNQWHAVQRDGPLFAVVCLAFMLVSVAIGFAFQRRLALAPTNAAASIICFPVRNVGVASLIAITLLDRLDYAGVAAVYFLVEVPLLAGLVLFLRRGLQAKNSDRSLSPS
jgi:BASS family bile acid:Na+ symporter